MTKARDLSKIIGAGGIIDNSKITLDANEIPNIDAGKITSGSIATARLGNVPAVDLTSLSASNLTSGTVPDARISSSAVSQHATSFDDNKIVNDISTLALRQSSNENKSAYNSNSMYVDVFQDTTGITGLTNAIYSSDEYINTNNASTVALTPTAINSQANYNVSSSAITSSVDGKANPTLGYTTSASNNGAIIMNFGSLKSNIKILDLGKYRGHGDPRTMRIQYSNASNSGGDQASINFSGATSTQIAKHQSSVSYPVGSTGATTGGASITSMDSSGNVNWSGEATNGYGTVRKIIGFAGFSAQYIRITLTANDFHDANSHIAEAKFYQETGSLSATGSFTSNNITAPSSVNKMGAIITYQNQAGTNALNTDIILKLSADGGSNFTTATLTAMPDFATGVKMAKVNDLTIGTAGTSLKYQILFANQSASKEARIRGVSLQY